MRYCIVGAGFSGAVLARRLAERGLSILVIDERDHVAGNCHTSRDPETGVMTHWYGPHIFHTGHQRVWSYVSDHAAMRPYDHRVKAVARGRVYALPINLLTINQFFGTTLSPNEAKAFIAAEARQRDGEPVSFEDQAMRSIGPALYEAFFRGYTLKQWGRDPKDLPAAILKRLPLRFDYNDSYFAHPYQAIPQDGYTKLVQSILDAPGIELRLTCRFEELSEPFAHVFYTGPIDRYFGYRLGRLGYRTLDFERFRDEGDYQGTAVLNYCDADVPFTRVTEHKHFAPWERDALTHTICFREFSRACGPDDIPYYPIRLVEEQALLRSYIDLARQTAGVSFLGRLGTYRYLDMDVTIKEALEAADTMEALLTEDRALPAFFVDPLRG